MYYIRPELLLDGARPWADLKAGFLKSVRRTSWEAGDSALFKKWFKSQGGRLNVTEVGKAARIMAAEGGSDDSDIARGRSPELNKLGEQIRRLSV